MTCHLIDHHSRGIRGCMYVLRLLCEEMSSICVCYEDGTYTLILIHFINIVTTHSPVPFISRHTTVYTLHALIVMYRHSPIHAYLSSLFFPVRTRSLDHLLDVEASSTGRCLDPMHTLFGAPHPSSFTANDGLSTPTPSSPSTISLKRGVIRTRSAHHGLVIVTSQDISIANPRYTHDFLLI